MNKQLIVYVGVLTLTVWTGAFSISFAQNNSDASIDARQAIDETSTAQTQAARDQHSMPHDTVNGDDMAQPVSTAPESTVPQELSNESPKGAADIADLAKPLETAAPALDLATPLDKDSAGTDSANSNKQPMVQTADHQKSVPLVKLNPRLTHPNQEAKLDLHYPENTPFPLVGIQFPIDYVESFPADLQRLKAFQKESSSSLEQMVGEQVVKSAYLAAALYEHLSERLPDKSVVLIPTRLQYDKVTNRVLSVPPAKPVPPVVLVDLSAGLSLDRIKEPASHLRDCDTFGVKAKTMVSMSMPIHGKRTVFAGQPVTLVDNDSVGEDLETFYNVECNKKKLISKDTIGGLTVSTKPVYTDGVFVSLPSEYRYDYSQLLIEPAAKQVALYSNVIIDALNCQSLLESKKALLAEYVADVDPELSEYVASNGAGSSPARVKDKVNWFNHCLLHERRELMGRETFDLSKDLRSPDFAQQHRNSMKGEADYAKQMSASKARSAFGSVLTFASTAGAIAGAFAPTHGIPVTSICSTLATSAASVVAAEAKLQQKLRQDFRQRIAQSRTTEVKCVVLMDNEKVEVDGGNLEVFRKNSVQGYAKKFGTTVSKQAGVL